MTKAARAYLYCFVSCLLLLAAIYIYPVSTRLTRISFLILLFCSFTCLIGFAIAAKRKRIVLVSLLVFLVSFKFIINNTKSLSEIYTERLDSYVGTKYVWGGENGWGIDCSGLVRRAMINALIVKGVSDFDFSKLHLAADIWWNDCTAKSLQKGFRNYTSPIGKVLSLNDADTSALKVGDLAITFDGVHVLAYASDGAWVEADPMVMEVIKKTTPSENVWFKLPMEIVRWNVLK